MAAPAVTSVGPHILLTGVPGIGKTTLIRRICRFLSKRGDRLRGFYTAEIRNGGTRIGFDIIPLPEDNANASYPLARVRANDSLDHGPKVGKYSVDVPSLDRAASAHLRRGGGGGGGATIPTDQGSQLTCYSDRPTFFIVDEIGKMELFSSTFKNLVSRLFETPSDGGGRNSGGSGRGLSITKRGRGRGSATRGRGLVAATTATTTATSTSTTTTTTSVGVNPSVSDAVVVIATLPVIPNQGKPNPFIEGIRNRKDAVLFTVTHENRDGLFDEIISFLSIPT